MNKRVLYVIDVQPRRIGGAESQLRELSLQPNTAGWNVVACLPSAPEGETAKFLETGGVEITIQPKVFRYGRDAFWSAFRLFRQIQPEVVHFSFVPGLNLLPWAARLAGVGTIVVTDQASRPEGFQPIPAQFLKRWLGRLILAPVDRMVSVSDYVLRCNQVVGYRPERKHVRISNATALGRSAISASAGADFRDRFNIPFDSIVVTQVAWLIPEKGAYDLLRAARIAVDRDRRLHFVFVLDGAHRARLERLRDELELHDHVTFAGLVIDPLAEGVYAATDIACHFARWQEAFGWVIAEAMSAGKPLVASRVGGIPEIVEEGVTGYLVPSAEAKSLADKINMLAMSPALRIAMGEAGRRKAESQFNLSDTTRQLVSVYGCVGAVAEMEKTAYA